MMLFAYTSASHRKYVSQKNVVTCDRNGHIIVDTFREPIILNFFKCTVTRTV